LFLQLGLVRQPATTTGDDHACNHSVAAWSAVDRNHPALSDLLMTQDWTLAQLERSRAVSEPRDRRGVSQAKSTLAPLESRHGASRAPAKERIMGNLLHYALVFLVVALVAAAVGFGGVAGVAMEGARLLFWVFIILFLVSLVAGVVRRS
jgi:uncharacterized membrane protein YtjA (UPF0391 family)